MEIIKECIHDLSSEEWKAYQIYLAINKYYSFIKGFTTLSFPKELLNDFFFEILNKDDLTGKNNIITISYNSDNPKLDLRLLQLHMMTFGICREFIDKSSSDNRRFITVWTPNNQFKNENQDITYTTVPNSFFSGKEYFKMLNNMKKTILILIAPLILLVFLGAGKNKQLENFTKLSDKTYLYNFEVSVGEYYQFLKANNFEVNLLPDTSVFKDTATFGDQIIPIGFSQEYFSSKYNQYPIVGITPSQAEKYCHWLFSTGKMNSEVKEVRLPNLNEFFSALYHQPIEVEFRQEDDNKFIGTNNFDENHWTDLCHIDLDKTLSKGIFKENLSGAQDSYVHICPVQAYANKETNNLLGNVSELVYLKHKGSLIIPIGNNFSGNVSYTGKLSNPSYLTWDESLIASKDQWNKPSAKIGFRYIIVLK